MKKLIAVAVLTLAVIGLAPAGAIAAGKKTAGNPHDDIRPGCDARAINRTAGNKFPGLLQA
jgi:hypothetical protein